jgi:3' terminal RNA ribose 2'-O-methyltransferase Hen1
MLLQITTTHQPATDLGFLLHKHPDRWQTVELSLGQAQVFYPEATEHTCTACLLLDLNPLALVRGERARGAFLPEHYVNDRPYTANSFLATALVKAFGSALNGTCHQRPDLAQTPLPLRATVHSLGINCAPEYLQRLFGPLGYEIDCEAIALDAEFPGWGQSRLVNLTLTKTTTLKQLLSQLYVFILVLDNDRHYWVSQGEVDVLVRRGQDWLDTHPEKEWITRRYLKNLPQLTSQALLRLAAEPEPEEATAAPVLERQPGLHQQRLELTLAQLKARGARRVIDLGCGEGKLLKMLLKDGQFTQLAGLDVSFTELRRARENLYLDQASPALRERLQLFQGSVTYLDERLRGYDAAALVEVIEHLDEERLPALEQVVFGFARPGTMVLTTPNAEYNRVYNQLATGAFRHTDHRFEWTRQQFADWCSHVGQTFGYQATIFPVGPEADNLGTPSQLAVFKKLG